ncbi:hypothetical protein G9A89_000582, partial [Geosiphon pyriformis]
MLIGISDNEEGIAPFGCDGILGLGLDQRAIKSKNSFFDTIIRQKKILDLRFSLYLPNDEKEGRMIIGGIPDGYAENEIEYNDVSPDEDGHWFINLDDVILIKEEDQKPIEMGFVGRKVHFDT